MTTPDRESAPVRPEVLLYAFRHTYNDSGLNTSLLPKALMHLSDTLNAPREAFPFRWCAAMPGETSIDVNLLYPLTLAWLRLDASVATDHIKTVLSGLRADGELPAILHASGGAPQQAAWPFAAQATEAVWRQTGDSSFLHYALPRLEKYLLWAMDYFDPTGAGKPSWSSADESFIPGAFEPGFIHLDLAIFLICDLAAFIRISRKDPSLSNNTVSFSDDYTRLTERLQDFFWDHRHMRYADRSADGAIPERVSIACILPLLYELLPQDRKNEVVEWLSPRKFGMVDGVPAWLPQATDSAPPSVYSMHQILVLEALRRSDLRPEIRELRQTLVSRLNQASVMGDNLRPESGETGTKEKELSTATAALIVLLPPEKSEQGLPTSSKIPGLIRWADHHRAVSIGVAATVIIAVLAAAGLYILFKPSLPYRSLETMAGLAQQYYRQGDYENTVRVCETILKGTPYAEALYFLMGNAYFRQQDYPNAEIAYRRVLEMERPPPGAPLNLALSVYRQGRLAEAAALYSAFIADYGKQYPTLAQKAETALSLIRAP